MIDRDARRRRPAVGLPPGFAVLAFDMEMRFVAVHGDALRQGGLRDDEILGRTAADLVVGNPDARPGARRLPGRAPRGRSRVRVRAAMRSWQVDASPLRHAHGHIIGGLVVATDVTARQQARRMHDARARAAELSRRPPRTSRAGWCARWRRCCCATRRSTGRRTGTARLHAAASWTGGRIRPRAPRRSRRVAVRARSRRAPGSSGRAFASGRWHAITDLLAAEDTPWVRAALEAGTRSAAAVPALRDGRAMGVFEFFGPVPIEDDPDVASALTRLVEDVAHAWERRAHTETLQTLADHDSLTGLLNRRRFEEELHSQAAAVARYGRHAALLVFDLDDFKAVNDGTATRSAMRCCGRSPRCCGAGCAPRTARHGSAGTSSPSSSRTPIPPWRPGWPRSSCATSPPCASPRARAYAPPPPSAWRRSRVRTGWAPCAVADQAMYAEKCRRR